MSFDVKSIMPVNNENAESDLSEIIRNAAVVLPKRGSKTERGGTVGFGFCAHNHLFSAGRLKS